MSPIKDKEQLYLNIAKACLAAINQHADAPPQQAYEQVYLAIDKAFDSELKSMLTTLQRQQKALQSIAKLNPSESHQAAALAEAALHEQH